MASFGGKLVGPPVVGFLFDRTGGYAAGLAFLAVLRMLACGRGGRAARRSRARRLTRRRYNASPILQRSSRFGHDSRRTRLVPHAVDRLRGRHADGRQSGLGAGIEGFAPVRAWVEKKKPDVLFYVCTTT